ncbi:Neurogenic locus notch-like protein [Thalictrum thalictroides]|uniref:Neurogenic locus notch-like protein n=1 Tax=Thalictrum thalictroides TaxID=46969 RepID=A0A7J6W037_THATH|nr:Neurogenic locus notch-like protein [Thalictrum thalictroides]
MNYACGAAPPPTPNVEEPPPKNISFYDPCYWAYCGDGTCNATRGHGFKCDCRPGFRNLMNVTSFPCFSDCVIGSDCASLGVTLSNETAVSSPNSPNSPSNYASSIMPSFLWLIVLMVPVAMAP